MFVSDETLRISFGRLTSSNSTGKVGTERTSALMYFLAFDLLVTRVLPGQPACVDLDPDTNKGRYNREMFVAQFMRLVTISQEPLLQIQSFGVVTQGSTPPEKRASANFLTTPLKRASQAAEAQAYPKRPAPLLELGQTEANVRWGVRRHPKWRTNFGRFITETRSNTPFIDLAVVVLRDANVADLEGNGADVLKLALQERFSDAVSSLWGRNIANEKMKPHSPPIVYQPAASRALRDAGHVKPAGEPPSRHRVSEGAHVQYLEDLLTSNGIPFTKEKK